VTLVTLAVGDAPPDRGTVPINFGTVFGFSSQSSTWTQEKFLSEIL